MRFPDKFDIISIDLEPTAKWLFHRLVFASDNRPIRSLEILNFSRFIGVDWLYIHKSVFTIKSAEDLKSKRGTNTKPARR